MTRRLQVAIACSPSTQSLYLSSEDMQRLRSFAEVTVGNFDVPAPIIGQRPPEDLGEERRLAQLVRHKDALIVCHGAPRVTAALIGSSPRLRVIGELEGDRFGGRIDVPAARASRITLVDTTHSSSWPVAEWALALMLLGLRQHGRFRDIIAGDVMSSDDYRENPPGRELTGRSVGLVGFGHIAWRLTDLLAPFDVRIVAHDPFAHRELADALHIDFGSLETTMDCDLVVCLAPATPATVGLIGAAEFALLRRDAVFVNVSRGVVVDTRALIAKANLGDAWFALDAHDPEPISVDSPLRRMRNVFLSPHIGGLTVEAQPRYFTLMVDELERYVSGLEPRAQLTDRVLLGRTALEQ